MANDETVQLELFDGRSTHSFTLPRKNLMIGKVRKRLPALKDLGQSLQERLAVPVSGAPLRELVKPGNQITIAADDYTRPTPVNLLLGTLLNELNSLGVPDENITLLVAAGLHREMTEEEKQTKYGKEACKRVKIVHHFAEDAAELVYIGETSRQIPVWVNKRIVECDLSIGIGTVEIHPWAGFAGGGKIVSPGVAGKVTIDATHMLPHEAGVEIGRIEGNPFWETCQEAARMAELGMIINTVMNAEGQVIELAVGEHRSAQLWAIEQFKQVSEIIFPEPVDIVVTTAYPKFQQWGQTAISMYNADRIIKDRGVRIAVADCPEDIGDTELEKKFYCNSLQTSHCCIEEYWNNWLGENNSLSRNTCAVYRYLQHLARSRAVLVTQNIPDNLVNQEVARDLKQLLVRELDKYGPSAKVAVYSHGALSLATVNAEEYKRAKFEVLPLKG